MSDTESSRISQTLRKGSVLNRNVIAENCKNYDEYLNNLVESGIEIPSKITCPICFCTIISVGALIHVEECMEWLKQLEGKSKVETRVKRKQVSQMESSLIPIEIEDVPEKKVKRKSKESILCNLPQNLCQLESRRSQRIPVILFDGKIEMKV
jgi:hypothetical protein